MGLTNLIKGFGVLGLSAPEIVSSDISFEAIKTKITNPQIAKELGAQNSIYYINEAEWCANLLDSFSESGQWGFVFEAQRRYDNILKKLPPQISNIMSIAVASAFNYFSYEQYIAIRIKRGDNFSFMEAAEYLLRRGSDSQLYALLLRELDGITEPGLESGFRIRQALWDLHDDILDLEEDKKSTGANICLLTGKNNLHRLAILFYTEAKKLSLKSSPLFLAIEKQLEKVFQII